MSAAEIGERTLQKRLATENVETRDLPALGAMIVRGPQETLDRLREPGGPLHDGEVQVVEDTEFFEQSASDS